MSRETAKLYIDTRDNKKILVKIIVNGIGYKKSSINPSVKSEVVLSLIDDILKDARIKKEDIGKIFIEKGPGSFTGLKVGIAIANALSFSLQKPVNKIILGKIETPLY